MRKIPKSLAIMGLLTPLVAPVSAGALGIGDIRLRSNLNQPLNAEIPLVTSGSDSLSDIKISLAPPEAFARAGIERQYFLSKLKFQAVQKADGSYIIQVTSQEPITEPFLNFLMEVNWPQGHLLREFTALVDPPATYEGRTVVSNDAPEFVAPAKRLAAEEPPKPAAARRSAAAPRSNGAEAPLPAAGSYGPVKKDETLWGIARLLARDTGVAPDRMMQALFQANPQAFSRNDINALKAGATLAIPSKDSIVQGRAVKPLETPPESTVASAQKPKTKPPTPAAAPEQAPRGELKLYTPSETKPESGTGSAPPAATGTPTAGTPAVPEKAAEAPAVDPRIAELQQKLNSLQGQLSIKDEQIATLQAQQQAKQAQPVPPPVQPPPVVETPAATPAPSAPPVVQATPVVAPTAPPVAQAPQPPVTPPPAPAKQPTPAPEAETNWFNWLPDAYYLEVAGAGTLLVGALIWVAVRRRAAMLDDFESMFPRDAQESAFSEIYAQKPADSKMPAPEGSSSFKSSFLVEFSASDFDALDTESDELDPISEADVYLAYGRYKQAEELIRNAIVQFPERDECKLKLLEIHYATENREAFESYAKELHGLKKDSDPEFWGKVMEMGRELCPDSALFYSSDSSILQLGGNDLFSRPAEEARSTEFIPLGTARSTSPDDEEAEISVEPPPVPTPAPPAKPDAGTMFDSLDFGESAEGPDDFILDFEAPTVPAKTAEPETPKAKESAPSGKAPMALDFDLDFLSAQDEVEVEQETAPILDFGDQSFEDLTDMNELETKLDLAKAFVDMDDVSSAREILEEIAQAGNDAQKKEARSLLAKIE
ncbi:MAG: FimV family protein [Methylococcaceae bacterium]|nr:FimV family protein [Methylococcaceae bacterium]